MAANYSEALQKFKATQPIQDVNLLDIFDLKQYQARLAKEFEFHNQLMEALDQCTLEQFDQF